MGVRGEVGGVDSSVVERSCDCDGSTETDVLVTDGSDLVPWVTASESEAGWASSTLSESKLRVRTLAPAEIASKTKIE